MFFYEVIEIFVLILWKT